MKGQITKDGPEHEIRVNPHASPNEYRDRLESDERALVAELRRVRVPHVEQLIAVIDRLAPPPPRVVEPAGLHFAEEAHVVESAVSVREVVEQYGGRYIETAESATIWIGDEKRREHFDEAPPRIARRLLLQWLRERQTGRAGP